jgi:hypothetical protein
MRCQVCCGMKQTEQVEDSNCVRFLLTATTCMPAAMLGSMVCIHVARRTAYRHSPLDQPTRNPCMAVPGWVTARSEDTLAMQHSTRQCTVNVKQ